MDPEVIARESAGTILPGAGAGAVRLGLVTPQDCLHLLERIDEDMEGLVDIDRPTTLRKGAGEMAMPSASLPEETLFDVPGYLALSELAEEMERGMSRASLDAKDKGSPGSRSVASIYARVLEVLRGLGDSLVGFHIDPTEGTGGISLRVRADGDLDVTLPAALAAMPSELSRAGSVALLELDARFDRAEAAMELAATVAEILVSVLSLLAGAGILVSTAKAVMLIAQAFKRLFDNI